MKEYKIKVNKELVSVSEEVYVTYYKMDRRERYLNEVSLEKDLSYNHLIDKEYPVQSKMGKVQKLLEDEVIENIMISKMIIAIKSLADDERKIICELFFNEKSIRELAAILGVSKSILHGKKERILKKLKKIINQI